GLPPVLSDAQVALQILDALRRGGEYGRRSESVVADLVDDGRFAVHWNGAQCDLDATVLFGLLRRVAQARNVYGSVQCLLELLGSGEDGAEATVRTAGRSLRRKLE